MVAVPVPPVHVPPPKPPVATWNKGDSNPPPSQNGPSLTSGDTSNLTPPKVPPQNGGSGTTVVDTASLDTFADNMSRLLTPVKDALTQLKAMPQVAAGLFPDAQTMETAVSGIPSDSSASSGSSGSGAAGADNLQANYIKVLSDLCDGLTDLKQAATTMSGKYTTADDLNNMSVTDLTNALNSSTSDFSKVMTDNGGSPADTSSGSSSGSGS